MGTEGAIVIRRSRWRVVPYILAVAFAGGFGALIVYGAVQADSTAVVMLGAVMGGPFVVVGVIGLVGLVPDLIVPRVIIRTAAA